jgi:hypothetical protein
VRRHRSRSGDPSARDWRGGVFNLNAYIIESLQVGIIETVGEDEDDDI